MKKSFSPSTFFKNIFIIALSILALNSTAFAFDVETQMVPMRDGINLATDIYMPGNNDKKLPTILMRTPYGKQIGAIFATTILSKRFVWVVQDTRGRFASEGFSRSFMDDTDDGYDTVEWIARQPWSNGHVGTTGISAMGITQYVMAADPSDHLDSQYVMAAAGSLYHDAAFIGGGFRRSLVLKWTGGNKFPPDFMEMLVNNYNYNSIWNNTNIHEHLDNIDYPILHMAGWYDIFLVGNIRAFQNIQENGAEGAKGKQHLIIGPWTHQGWCGLTGTRQGQITYPENSKYNMIKKMMPWFEETMLGKDKGFISGPAVEYYVMGDPEDRTAPGNTWRTADSWPPPSQLTPYYFHADNTLSPEKPTGNDFASLVADPNNPVPSVGGANLVLKAGPYDQREIESRDDVLLYTTNALTEPLEITGELNAVLYIKTDVPDTDYAVRLMDVYPDGRSMLVADSVVRASHREGADHLAPALQPETVYALNVNLASTSLILNKGHRIRISISGTNFPRFDVNFNNGKFFDLDEGELTAAVNDNLSKYVNTPDTAPDTRIANSKIFLSSEYPSHFIFPVVSAQ